ncbi:hypothetical protein FGB62_7g324 [Gracilaria domingensis]|nr:hypothetical protein FGB62_7g324 [Gracilaria domingensis]
MKGARRTRNRPGAGFADLMAVPPQPRRGVITGMSRFHQHSNSNTPTATAQTTPSSSTPSTPRPSPPDEDWDSLLNISPRRRISPVKSKLGSRSRPGSTSMDRIPNRTPKVSSLKLSSSRQSMPPLSSPSAPAINEPSQLPPISPREEPRPTPSARSSLTPVPSFLAGWEGNDGWGDDALDESDPEVDDDAWGGWGDTADISIPEQTTSPIVSAAPPSPVTRPRALPTEVKQDALVIDAVEHRGDAPNAGARTSSSEATLQQNTPINFEVIAAVEEHTQRSEQEETEPGNHLTTLVPAEAEKSVTEPEAQPDAQTANTDNDKAWGEWEETFDVSLESAPVSRNDVGLTDEPPQEMSVPFGKSTPIDFDMHAGIEDQVRHSEEEETGPDSHFATLESGDAEKSATEPEAEPERQGASRDNDNAWAEWEETFDNTLQSVPVSRNDVGLVDEPPQEKSVPFSKSTPVNFEVPAADEDQTRHSEQEGTQPDNHFTTLECGEANKSVAEPKLEPDGQAANTDNDNAWGVWEETFDLSLQSAPVSKNDANSVDQSPQQISVPFGQSAPMNFEMPVEDHMQRLEQEETEPDSHFTKLESGEAQEAVTEPEAQAAHVENSDAGGEFEESFAVSVAFEDPAQHTNPEETNPDNQSTTLVPGDAEKSAPKSEAQPQAHPQAQSANMGDEDEWGKSEDTSDVVVQTAPTSNNGVSVVDVPLQQISVPPEQSTHISSEVPVTVEDPAKHSSPEETAPDTHFITMVPGDAEKSVTEPEAHPGAQGATTENNDPWGEWEETFDVPVEPVPISKSIDFVDEPPQEVSFQRAVQKDVDSLIENPSVLDEPNATFLEDGNQLEMAKSSEHEEHDFVLKPETSASFTSVGEVKSGMAEPDTMFSAAFSGRQTQECVTGVSHLSSSSQPRTTFCAVDNTTELGGPGPGAWTATFPEPANDEENRESVHSDIWGGWDAVQNNSVPEGNDVNGPVGTKKQSSPLNSSLTIQDPSNGNKMVPEAQEHTALENLDNRTVDDAFFSVPAGKVEHSEPIPFGQEEASGGDEDIWGGWDHAEDFPLEAETTVARPLEQNGTSAVFSPIVSKQVGLDGNEDTAGQEADEGLREHVRNSAEGGKGAAMDESKVAENSNYRTAEEEDDSTSFNVKESSVERKTAISTSYWTEKLNSANVQELERKESSSFLTSGAQAYPTGDSQRTADAAHAKISTAPGLEGQSLNYDPFAPAEHMDASNQSGFDGFDIAGTPADETVWYQQDTERTEAAKMGADEYKPNQANEEYISFDSKPQSELTNKTEVSELPAGVQQSGEADVFEAPPGLITTPSQTYDPFQPAAAVAQAFNQSRTFGQKPRSRNASPSKRTSPFQSFAPSRGIAEDTSQDQQFNLIEAEKEPDAKESTDERVHLLSDAPVIEQSFAVDSLPNGAHLHDSFMHTAYDSKPGSSYSEGDKPQLNDKDITEEEPSHVSITSEKDGNEPTTAALGYESSSLQVSPNGDFETNPYAPNTFGKSETENNFQKDSPQGALQHGSENVLDSGEGIDQDQVFGDSLTPNQPETQSFGNESDFRIYAPRPSQTFSAPPQDAQESYIPPLSGNDAASLGSTGRLIPFSQEGSQAAKLGGSESHVNYSEPTQHASPTVDAPEGHPDPYKLIPESSDIAQSFEPRQVYISEDNGDSAANYAPRQRLPAAPSETVVERNVPVAELYPASYQEPGTCLEVGEGAHNTSVNGDPYSTMAFQATRNDLSAAYWGQGGMEQENVETSADEGFSMPASTHSTNPCLVPKDSLSSYENASELSPAKGTLPVETPLPNAYAYDGYGNYTASAPTVPETQQDSTYLDTSLFSYPFSIMDTNPSGDMIQLGPRPIISWGFAGSFVTVFPSMQDEQLDRVSSIPKDDNSGSQSVQVFDVTALSGDGTNDDWVAAAEAVEPVSYPVQVSELEAYAKMCDGLSQLSVGLRGPAAESRAALWRVLALLCRTGHGDWRRSASRAVCGPTSVPLFGKKPEASAALKQKDDSSSGSFSKKSDFSDRDVTNEVERLLTEGKGVEAVNCAKTSGLWSLALVLAGLIDRKLYMSVLCDFAKVTLHEGSALQTLCFSLSENDSEITRRITSTAGLGDWRKNVGMLLTSVASIATDNEKRKRFMSLIDQVGDALLSQNDDIVGSHVCYLLSGRLHSLDRNAICLLGANPNIAPGLPRSFGSPAAILQSIIFEATVNARNGKTFPHLLPFRLLLALEIASVGRAEVALAHCNSISKEVRAIFDSGNSVAAQLFTPPFLSCLESFEQQLRAHLGVEEKGEKLTRLSALGKSLSSVFARGLKDQAEKESPQELASQNLRTVSQSFLPTPSTGFGQVHVAPDRIHVNQPPHLSIDSQPAGVFNPAEASKFSNDSNQASVLKEKSGKEKWNSFVQKTVGLIAPADLDLSPPPPSRAPPAAFLAQAQPAQFGLDGGAGTRAIGQPLTPSHMRSSSVGALPSEYFSGSQFAGTAETTSGQQIQSYEVRPHVSTPQIDMSAGKTEQTVFNGVPVQKVTREEKSNALVHRRSASDMTLQSQTSEKKPPLHPKKPARASKQTDTSMENPQSKKGWRERLREKLTAAFGGPPRAHMGEENKFVFDKQRGRWVIEGEDPEEEEDVPPPPPDDDNMFGSEGSNVQTSASYDLLPNPSNSDHNSTALMRSQSAQDAHDLNDLNMSNSHDQVSTPFNPLSSYPGSLDNSVGGDDGSATSVASAASAPVPYSAAPSYTTSSARNGNKYRAGGGRRSNRRAYVDTFNKGRPPAPTPAIATPARPAVPGFGGMTSASGGYKIFTPTPVPSTSTGNSDERHGANSSASVVETSDQMTASGSEVSSTQNAPTTSSSHGCLTSRPRVILQALDREDNLV